MANSRENPGFDTNAESRVLAPFYYVVKSPGAFRDENEKLQIAGLLLNGINAIRHIAIILDTKLSQSDDNEQSFMENIAESLVHLGDADTISHNIDFLAKVVLTGEDHPEKEKVRTNVEELNQKYNANRPNFAFGNAIELESKDDLERLLKNLASKELHHDLRGSLTSAIGFMRLAQRRVAMGTNDDVRVEEVRGRILENVKRFLLLSEGINSFTLTRESYEDESNTEVLRSAAAVKEIFDTIFQSELSLSFGEQDVDLTAHLLSEGAQNLEEFMVLLPEKYVIRLAQNIAQNSVNALKRKEHNTGQSPSARRIILGYAITNKGFAVAASHNGDHFPDEIVREGYGRGITRGGHGDGMRTMEGIVKEYGGELKQRNDGDLATQIVVLKKVSKHK